MMSNTEGTTTPSLVTSNSAPERLTINSSQVHVWCADLNIHSDRLHKYYHTLSADERDRSARFKFQKDRDGYIAAHGILRAVLSRYVNTKPCQLRFYANNFGKPSLDTSTGPGMPRFNMAHSSGLALFCISRDREVGIDLETIRPLDEIKEIAAQSFSPKEVETLLALPDKEQVEAFYTCWTRKEAYVKARGMGLSLPLDRFDVSLSPDEPARLLASREDPQETFRWTLMGFNPRPNFVAALAVAGHGWQVKFWHWSDE
ncbi:MAG: 4'-phosphopantetheinyl transferase superfamily protein [Gemmatimonadota bacterium]|nr:MAG: 4'-phosphopantetheinyl transferase superfamily protein [Gemmatimonadota bacterium]